MKQQINNGQLAAILSHLLTDPFSGEIDDQEQFEQFCTDLANVVCNYCGSKVTTPASYAPEESNLDWATHYVMEVNSNESTPDDGGIWANTAVRDKSSARAVVSNLLAVLHPGAIGLIHNEHGEDRGKEAEDAVLDAKMFLGRGSAKKVLHGYFGHEGTALEAEFEVPLGATVAEKDAAFMAALAQQADIAYS